MNYLDTSIRLLFFADGKVKLQPQRIACHNFIDKTKIFTIFYGIYGAFSRLRQPVLVVEDSSQLPVKEKCYGNIAIVLLIYELHNLLDDLFGLLQPAL